MHAFQGHPGCSYNRLSGAAEARQVCLTVSGCERETEALRRCFMKLTFASFQKHGGLKGSRDEQKKGFFPWKTQLLRQRCNKGEGAYPKPVLN